MRGSRAVTVAMLVTMTLLGAACGSSDDDAGDAPTTTVAGTSEECPFDGSTDAQNEPGPNTATELGTVTAEADGCIDNVSFGFDPTLATSKTEYQAPAPAEGAVLLVNLGETTLADGLQTGNVEVPDTINYVKSIELDQSGDEVVWRITLDKERPFLVSSSNVPPELILAIG